MTTANIASAYNRILTLAIPRTGRLQLLGWNLLLAAIYFLAAKFGLSFASINASATAIWPPTGIAFAALVLYGYRLWPGIFLGALLANSSTAGTFLTSFFIAGGNTLEALAGAYLANTFANGRRAFDNVRDTFRFIILGGLISPLISSFIGISVLGIAGLATRSSLDSIWITWWLGDVGGAILVAPLFILWISAMGDFSTFRKFQTIIPDRSSITELVLALLAMTISTFVVFEGILPFIPKNYPLTYLILPPLLWIALRFRRRITSAVVALVAIAAVHGTLHGFGPFGALPIKETLPVMQIFLIVTSATMLLMTVLLTERIRSHRTLGIREKHFRSLIEKSSDGIILLDENGIIKYRSPSLFPILGYAPEELLGTSGIGLVYSSEEPSIQTAAFRELVSKPGSVNKTEAKFQKKDGSWIWVESTVSNQLHEPEVAAIVVNFRDSTDRKQFQEKKVQFVSFMSHQLYTPLGALRRYTTSLMAKKGHLPFMEQKYLEEVNRSQLEMLKIVDDILKASRLELGTFALQPRLTELRREVDGAIGRSISHITAKEIKLKKAYSVGHVTFNIDSMLFSPILSDLLLKAISHTPMKGTLTVEISKILGQAVIRMVSSGTEVIKPNKPSSNEKAHLLVAQALATYMGMDIIETEEPEKNERSLALVIPWPEDL